MMRKKGTWPRGRPSRGGHEEESRIEILPEKKRIMQNPFRWWIPALLSILIATFVIFAMLKLQSLVNFSGLAMGVLMAGGIIASPVLLLLSWGLSLAVHGIWKKVRLKKQKGGL
jgi:hypothetical protein